MASGAELSDARASASEGGCSGAARCARTGAAKRPLPRLFGGGCAGAGGASAACCAISWRPRPLPRPAPGPKLPLEAKGSRAAGAWGSYRPVANACALALMMSSSVAAGGGRWLGASCPLPTLALAPAAPDGALECDSAPLADGCSCCWLLLLSCDEAERWPSDSPAFGMCGAPPSPRLSSAALSAGVAAAGVGMGAAAPRSGKSVSPKPPTSTRCGGSCGASCTAVVAACPERGVSSNSGSGSAAALW